MSEDSVRNSRHVSAGDEMRTVAAFTSNSVTDEWTFTVKSNRAHEGRPLPDGQFYPQSEDVPKSVKEALILFAVGLGYADALIRYTGDDARKPHQEASETYVVARNIQSFETNEELEKRK